MVRQLENIDSIKVVNVDNSMILLNNFVKNCPDPAVIVIDKKIVDVNDKAKELFKVSSLHNISTLKLPEEIFTGGGSVVANFNIDPQTEFSADLGITNINWKEKTYRIVIFKNIYRAGSQEEEIRKLTRELNEVKQVIKTTKLTTNDAIYDWNIKTGEVKWNKNFFEIFGYTPQEVALDNAFWVNHLHPNDVHRVKYSTRKFIDSSEKQITMEYRFRKSDGNYIYLKDTGCKVFDEDNTPLRIVGSMNNISVQKAAEEALAHQNKITQIITDNATSALFMMDQKGHCTFMNPAAEKMTGYKLEEIKDIPLHDAIHHTHADGSEYKKTDCPVYNALTQVKNLHGHEEVFVRKNGSFFPALCSVSAIVENGEAIGTIIEVKDITKEKEAAQKLKESKERLQLVLETLPQMAWTSNPDGSGEYFNSKWKEFTGENKAGLQKGGWKKFIHPDDLETTVQKWKHSIETGEDFEMEYRWKRISDDKYRWLLGRSLPVKNENGEIKLWVGTCTDIDEQKRVQEEISSKNKSLEIINNIGKTLLAELDVEKIVQAVTDSTTELVGAEFGAFFYNVNDENDDKYYLYALSGIAKEKFASFPNPRKTEIFAPTFNGEGIIRSDDITKDPRYGKTHPYYGMPKGHVPVKSYLAVPVISKDGSVIGALFYGHSKPGVFTKTSEDMVAGVAIHATIAMDNARLFQKLNHANNDKKILLEEAKNAHGNAEAQRQNLHNLLMKAPALICILKGKDLEFELVNPTFASFFGNRDFLGKKVTEAMPELVDQPFINILRKVYSSGESFTGSEFPGLFSVKGSSDLEKKYVNFIYQAKHNSEGEIDGIIVFGYDVTEQVKARQSIEDYAQRLRLMLEAIPQMAWTADANGVVTYYNDRWYSYIRSTEEGLGGWSWKNVIHPDDFYLTMKKWKKSVATGTPFEVQNRFKRGVDGEFRWHLTRALPLKNAQGEIYQWVGTCTDIHEQQKANDNLAFAREQLTTINLELSRKNEELLRINNDLDNFVYTASHDLKAPISNLEGLVTSLKEEVGELPHTDVENLFNMVKVSVKKFKDTINDLTDISRLQKEKIEDEQHIQINEMLDEIYLLMQKVDNQVVLHRELEVGEISFSRKNFRSILYNLLINAVKYKSPERKPEVLIRSHLKDGNFVLQVYDNGLGIPTESQGKVFNMFKRMHDHVEGTGLGLYIVKKIVNNSGGKVELESKVNSGTTLTIYIPQH